MAQNVLQSTSFKIVDQKGFNAIALKPALAFNTLALKAFAGGFPLIGRWKKVVGPMFVCMY